jgi:hypothetical protein
VLSLHPILRAIYKILAALIVAFTYCGGASAQATKPPQQPLNLPNPTPRPPDLEQKYGTNSAELAHQQQLAALKVAQLRQQLIVTADKLLQLTQELENDVGKRENGAPMTPQAVKAGQIEKLAKTVKEKTKLQ